MCLGNRHLRLLAGQPHCYPLCMTLHPAWAALPARLKMLEPVPFSAEQWSLIERLHATFNDREAHTHLPIPIARFCEDATKGIYGYARQFDVVETVNVNDRWLSGTPDAMATYARL